MAIEVKTSARILVTGGTGLVGRALAALLAREGYANVVGVGSRDFDLRSDAEVARMYRDTRPDYVFHLAAKVYGIGGNQRYKSDVLYENVLINTHVVEHGRRAGVKKLVAMGSGCVYPELPGVEELREEQIWLGPPHPSEDSYAHSKRLMLAQLIAAKEQYGFQSAFAISGNLYGPHDSFDIEFGHVTPALVAKFFNAKRDGSPVRIWGSGIAVRDFSHADDAALGLLAVLRHADGPINLGSGMRHAIREIVDALVDATGGTVKTEWDASKPDGQHRRFYEMSRLWATGFRPRVTLREGVRSTYEWYAANWPNVRTGEAEPRHRTTEARGLLPGAHP
ncbi:MAG: NAD-dependent epimerase/dehydratase family protein [Burkholderiaceae bacterium]|nr:NAD-dependent epimerase/dehydratase family protein [Burkholderiaceae bacterium]